MQKIIITEGVKIKFRVERNTTKRIWGLVKYLNCECRIRYCECYHINLMYAWVICYQYEANFVMEGSLLYLAIFRAQISFINSWCTMGQVIYFYLLLGLNYSSNNLWESLWVAIQHLMYLLWFIGNNVDERTASDRVVMHHFGGHLLKLTYLGAEEWCINFLWSPIEWIFHLIDWA